MDDRSIQTGGSEHLPPPVARSGSGDAPLADPRALTILATEHWSLLSARSLVYNEAFARTGMFLTFLSASLGAVVARLIGAAPNVAIVVGIGTFLVLLVVMSMVGFRNFSRFGARLGPRFPTPPPGPAPASPKGR